MIVFLDKSSTLKKDFIKTLNKTLMTEWRIFQRAVQPVVEEVKSEEKARLLSSTVREYEERSYGNWHSATFLLKPKRNEPLLEVGDILFYSFASVNSYTNVTSIYNDISYRDSKIWSGKSDSQTYRVSLYWRTNDRNN